MLSPCFHAGPFSPFNCFFCNEPIIILDGFSHRSKSRVTHHIDWNHDNDDPWNVAYAHYGCHSSYHRSFFVVVKHTEITVKACENLSEYHRQYYLKVQKLKDMAKEDNDFMFWWKYEDKNVKLIEAK